MAIYVIHPTDEQEKFLMAFLEDSEIPFVKDDEGPLPQHVLDGIAQGQADIEAGRFITYDEFKKRMKSTK
ncbi:hypothetical protein [Mucilaginibacter gotjawali]|uniref:Uncharacterized protein n=2 Tax=Mucilaginibacter gotjawali TaxID=1550579 RepID=A0A110B417_9SPHI|nr:hypothetical protein [Mucilaginibacter gotjawali]MBB3059079.1 hypothetical protein [Mucilaginibacter gotjawali]BAU52848.1 hypothetical protein MgSA37_01012 [Mucilaginibacter gotjawali]